MVNFLLNTKSENGIKNIWATCYHALTRNICIKAVCGNNLQIYGQSQRNSPTQVTFTYQYHADHNMTATTLVRTVESLHCSC